MDYTLIIGFLALIPVSFFIYDRFIRIKHRVHVEHGNIAFSRIVSESTGRNDRLALLILDLKLINSAKEPYTIKELVLRYTYDGNKKESHPYNVPVGTIEGRKVIATTNGIDTVVMVWQNISEILAGRPVLQPGQVVSGSVLFVLDGTKESMRSISDFSILVRDFSGNETEHLNQAQDSWYQGIDKGMALIDAPPSKRGDLIIWEGVELGVRPSA